MIKFKCQENAIQQLCELAKTQKHSILIDGPSGCGKTRLAKYYAETLGIEDFQTITPTVQTIRESIEAFCNLTSPLVLCIENLDTGVLAASYALLKFLEEPRQNIYVVVTCQNLAYIPDTIISRSACISVNPPIDSDIAEYASIKDSTKYQILSKYSIWKAVKTFKDIDTVFNLTHDHLEYYESLKSLITFKDSISSMTWKLGHYDNDEATPIEFVIRYIVTLLKDPYQKRKGIECVKDLQSGKIAAHAIVTKFLFICKYTE